MTLRTHLPTALATAAVVSWFALFVPDRWSFAVGCTVVAGLVLAAYWKEQG